MKQFKLVILLLCTVYAANAQTLRGRVVDGESGKALAAVTVSNLSTGQSSYTDNNGEFRIMAKTGDQVSFSFIGYRIQQKTVAASLGVPEMYIDLFRLSYQLEEFIYRPKYTPYQLDSIERRATYSRTLARQRTNTIMSPVSFLAERLSRRSKQIMKFQKNFNYWEEERFIESRYSRELVQQMTGLKGDTLAWFMNANPLPFDFARVASELELKMWIRERLRLWQRKPQYLHLDAAR